MGHGFEQNSVSELRERLVKDYGWKPEDAIALSPKSAVVAKLIELQNNQQNAEPILDIDEIIEEAEKEEKVELAGVNEIAAAPEAPDMFAPEWHDYVMSLFRGDEMQDGNPTADGLRRIAQQVLGPIVESRPQIKEGASELNGHRATVEYFITFLWQRPDAREGLKVVFGAAADSCNSNTDATYRQYPTAIAEARAEGRALRKALGLRKTVTAEEISNVASEDSTDSFGKIASQQVMAIDKLCKKLNIDVLKFINIGKDKYENIKEVPYDVAVKMLVELNKYQNNPEQTPEAKGIPDSVIGYQDGWRG